MWVYYSVLGSQEPDTPLRQVTQDPTCRSSSIQQISCSFTSPHHHPLGLSIQPSTHIASSPPPTFTLLNPPKHLHRNTHSQIPAPIESHHGFAPTSKHIRLSRSTQCIICQWVRLHRFLACMALTIDATIGHWDYGK